MSPQDENCFVSHLWCLKFGNGWQISDISVQPCLLVSYLIRRNSSARLWNCPSILWCRLPTATTRANLLHVARCINLPQTASFSVLLTQIKKHADLQTLWHYRSKPSGSKRYTNKIPVHLYWRYIKKCREWIPSKFPAPSRSAQVAYGSQEWWSDNRKKVKAIPLQAWTGLEGSRSFRLPDFKTIGTWRW